MSRSKTELTDNQVELIARALSEPRRMQMLRQIGSQAAPMPCAALLDLHDVGPATISRHVRELQLAGLIKGTRRGKCMDYEVDREVLAAYLERLAEI